jgi:type I restriction enzyme S subunit
MGQAIVAPLGELLHKSDDWISLDPDHDYQEITVRVRGRGVIPRGVRKGMDIGASRRLRVRQGQFIISRIDARHGASGIIPPELDGGVVSGDFPVYDCDESRLRPGYLHWLSKTPAFVDACRAASEGSTNRVRLREARFTEIMLRLPPVSEQDSIVAQIDRVAVKLDEAQRLRSAVSDDAKALLQSVFHRLIQGANYRPLGEVAPIVRRPVEIQPDQSYDEIGIRSFHNGTFFKGTSDGAAISHKKMFQMDPGALVFSNIMAWEGAIAVVRPEDEGRIGVHRFITCVPEPDRADPYFLWFYFQTDEGFAKVVKASPATIARNRTLNAKKLPTIEVPVPPLPKQRAFAALHAKVQAIQDTQAANQVQLDALLPAVLDKAFKFCL